LAKVELRVGPGVTTGDVQRARAAATAVGARTDLAGEAPEKVRFLGEVDDADRLAAVDAGLWVDEAPIAADPNREVLRWVREQAVSESRHRHGNVTARRPGVIGRGRGGTVGS
jgi:hypothetical protein